MFLEFTFTCPLPNGFHARPASHLAGLANDFLSDCVLTNLRNGSTADIKSVLSIIAADVRMNDECSVRIHGADEQIACTALRRFVANDLPMHDVPLAELVQDGKSRELPRSLRTAGARAHFGSALSGGIGQGKAMVVKTLELSPDAQPVNRLDLSREQEQVKRSIAAVRARIQNKMLAHVAATEAAILQAHLAILGDVSLMSKLLELVAQGRSATQAMMEAGRFFGELLRRSENAYTRERALDVQDICLELVEEASGSKSKSIVELSTPSVIIAENLTPQQLLALERKWISGLVLECAGTTSHTVILARSLGIPTLVGVKDAQTLARGVEVLVDANRGFLVTELTSAVHKFYQRESRTLERRQAALARYARSTAHTSDCRAIQVAANVSSAEELESVFQTGADGIGLFRTEMLFLGRDNIPSEEEQFQVYAQAARLANDKPVVLRTIDIGGDKTLPALKIPAEDNPFLGYRGARIYPEHQDVLRAQLRAVCRASAFGRIHLMAPMVSSLEEVLWFKDQVNRVQQELEDEKILFDRSMSLGIMVEVPSVAFIVDQLCAELDFFSIGTNDLSQYFFAADRGNSKVAGLANVRHPAFLRFLQQIVGGINKHKKFVAMCGDMASDLQNLPLLMALGLNEISVPAAEIPVIKERIARLSIADCQKLFSEALVCRRASEVERLLDREPTGTARRLLDRELILLRHDIDSKEEAIREIVDALYVEGRTDDPDRLEEAVWKRESVYSTGLGYGFAVPHCKTDVISSGSIGILKLVKPVEWNALDGLPVRMVILLAARESDAGAEHLRVFSQLARNLMDEKFREQLLGADDCDAIVTVLSKGIRSIAKIAITAESAKKRNTKTETTHNH